MEAETGRWRKGPQAKKYRQPLEAERAKKLTLLSEPPEGTSPVHTLTSAQ